MQICPKPTRSAAARWILGVVAAVCATQLTLVAAAAETPRQVKRHVVELAADTAVPPSLALAVASVESGFRDDLESAAGARGVMQITPEAARRFGVRPDALWDARENIALGLRMLTQFFREADHEWRPALRRYAAAMPGGYDAGHFARRVLRLERRFAEEIVTRKALESRKREVLNVAGLDPQGIDWTDTAPVRTAKARSPEVRHARARPAIAPRPLPPQRSVAITWSETPGPGPASNLGLDDFGSEFERRRRLARRTLDDFASGRIVGTVQ